MPAHKFTAVGRLLNQEHRGTPLSLPMSSEQYEDPTFISRLSFRHGPRVPTDVGELTRCLSLHVDHAVFIDTNLTWLPDAWWQEALAEPGRVHITTRVLQELMPFFGRNPGHPLLKALSQDHPGITLRPDPEDDVGSACLDYYVVLLSQRRHLLRGRVAGFVERNGRAPSSRELAEFKMDLQRQFGERTLHLNTKEISPRRTDEALVFEAAYHAVTTGQRTKIFSGDLDVEEQFYMMVRLLTTHYFGLLIADEYVADFSRFAPRSINPRSRPGMKLTFSPQCAAVLNLGDRGIHSFIPKLTSFVPISCTTVGKHYTSEVTYGAETTMSRVFTTKSKTLGLSTDQLAGRNIHPWCVPEHLTPPGDHGALVAFDEYLETRASGMRVALLDISMTMAPEDPHIRLARPAAEQTDQPQLTPATSTGQVIAMRARTPHHAGLWVPGSAAA